MMGHIKTKFLVISDTHGDEKIHLPPLPEPVDVAIHCGDLTDQSKIAEFHTTLDLLRSINSPLKLVIAGNHDFTLDTPMHQQKAAEANRLFSIEPALMKKEYGGFGEARQLIEASASDGIVFLDEGVHHFDLANGAHLTVYASPFTQSIEADWGFQYKRGDTHEFNIGHGVDVAITHGPPKGVLDMTASKQRAGCDQLFAAIAKAKPRMHCFGHIHEGWGAKAVAWRADVGDNPTHFSAIDNGSSAVVETLNTLRPGKWDTPDIVAEKEARSLLRNGYIHTSHCAGDEHPITPGQSTLFVNAAIEPTLEGEEQQLAWLVDIELPPSASESSPPQALALAPKPPSREPRRQVRLPSPNLASPYKARVSTLTSSGPRRPVSSRITKRIRPQGGRIHARRGRSGGQLYDERLAHALAQC